MTLHYKGLIYYSEGTVKKGEGAAATGGVKLPYTYPVDSKIIDLKLVGFTTIDLYHETAGKIATLDPASVKSYLGSVKDKMLAGSKALQDAVKEGGGFYLYHEEAVGGAVADTPYIICFTALQ